MDPQIEKRDAGIVLVLSLFTCGLYLFYWYYKVYEELELLAGKTPTGNSYFVDLLLVIVSCSLWGIWVDYQISMQLNELQKERGITSPDSTMLAVGLDVCAYLTGMMCNYITSAVQQDQLNKIAQAEVIAPSGRGPSSVPSTF
jgi:hypothetical protein